MSLRNVLNRLQASVDELYAKSNRGASSLLALENRAYANNPGTLPSDPTAGSSIIVMAAKLTTRASGIFLGSVNLSATGLTPTDTVQTELATVQGTGMTLANDTSVGYAPAGSGSTITNGVYVANAAAGILITGGGAAPVQFNSGAQVQPTGGTSWQFSWSGILQNGNPSAGLAPFSGDVLFYVLVNRSAAAMTFASVGMSFLELP